MGAARRLGIVTLHTETASDGRVASDLDGDAGHVGRSQRNQSEADDCGRLGGRVRCANDLEHVRRGTERRRNERTVGANSTGCELKPSSVAATQHQRASSGRCSNALSVHNRLSPDNKCRSRVDSSAQPSVFDNSRSGQVGKANKSET